MKQTIRSLRESVLIEGKNDPQLGDVYDDSYYHHTTATSNLSGIKSRGLVGSKPATFTGYEKNNSKVHLAPDLDSTEYWFGMVSHMAGGKVTLLRVKKSAVTVEKSFRRAEVLTDEVPANKLEYLDGNKWKKL